MGSGGSQNEVVCVFCCVLSGECLVTLIQADIPPSPSTSSTSLSFKETVWRDFLLLVFFMNHLPHSSWHPPQPFLPPPPPPPLLLFHLKWQCHEIFCFWVFFSWIIFPQASENNRGIFAAGVKDTGFFKNLKFKIKIFLIEDFFHLPPESTTLVVHLDLQISPWIFTKIWNGLNGILRGLGKLIHEKNLNSKISWHCPFNIFFSKRESAR